MLRILLIIVVYLKCYTDSAYFQKDLLWYANPALNFNEALPIGNGRIGAMVHGWVQNEYISLNENTLGSGGPNTKWNNPDTEISAIY